MEKNTEFYNLIEKLIREHRKFPGYEAILEDIAEDVYAHSEVVINSIQNKSVIESYLQKVISTSIISVPKKLNFNNSSKVRRIESTVENRSSVETSGVTANVVPKYESEPFEEINNQEEEPQIELNEEEHLDESLEEIAVAEDLNPKETERANFAYVDNMINSITSDTLSENKTDELFTDTDDILADSEKVDIEPDIKVEYTEIASEDGQLMAENSDELSSELSTDDIVIAEHEISDEVLEEEPLEISDSTEIENSGQEEILSEDAADEEENSEEEKFSVLTETEEYSKKDNNELMNISDESEGFSTLELQEPDEEESDSESLQESDDTQEVEVFELQELGEDEDVNEEPETESEEVAVIESFELQEPEEDETKNEELLTETNQNDDVEVLDLQETEESSDKTESLEVQDSEEETFIPDAELNDFVDDEIGNEFSDIDSMNTDMDLDENGESDNMDLSIEQNDLGLLDESNDSDMELFGAPKDNSEQKDEKILFKPMDYSLFETEVSVAADISDNNAVISKIQDLNNTYPELNILDVFNLKYKNNMSLDDIAKELNTAKAEVLTALNKLVDIV